MSEKEYEGLTTEYEGRQPVVMNNPLISFGSVELCYQFHYNSDKSLFTKVAPGKVGGKEYNAVGHNGQICLFEDNVKVCLHTKKLSELEHGTCFRSVLSRGTLCKINPVEILGKTFNCIDSDCKLHFLENVTVNIVEA